LEEKLKRCIEQRQTELNDKEKRLRVQKEENVQKHRNKRLLNAKNIKRGKESPHRFYYQENSSVNSLTTVNFNSFTELIPVLTSKSTFCNILYAIMIKPEMSQCGMLIIQKA
jgi:hypothetical protein